MKKIVSIVLLSLSLFTVQGNEPEEKRQIKLIRYDNLSKELDYSNTICDTLIAGSDTILLDESPLMQKIQLTKTNTDAYLNRKNIYNCSRGFIAKWVIIDEKLYLTGIQFLSSDVEKQIKEQIKLPRHKNLLADWVNGDIRGGSDAVKTNYGYAFKNEFIFTFSSGSKTSEAIRRIPYGALENNQKLSLFFKKNSETLLSTLLSRIDSLITGYATQNDTSRFHGTINIYSSMVGVSYLALRNSQSRIELGGFIRDKTLEAIGLIAKMNFVNLFPAKSFYPRFLRDGIIYMPYDIEYTYNLDRQIINTQLIYQVPQQLENEFIHPIAK
ncbi:hypothetical protein [Maribellus sp. YY47]|uniref:hypothetical protein n=1 Tax=Maribellus sp. YY47 TaxID=2929486 RepID=UPI002000911B|nr:hypothetical protein [Maribellus sp. YY47]MCK3684523.1 hypothetical protein [Maribellus sp. YY47]